MRNNRSITKSFGEYSSAVLGNGRTAESGRVLSLALLLCIAVASGLVFGGKQYLEANLPPFYATLCILGAAVICIFSLGCGLHLFFMGGKSNGELRRSLIAQKKALVELVAESDAFIRQHEAELSRNTLKISARGIDCLAMSRRVVRALDNRLAEIEVFIKRGDTADLIDADELFRKKLVIADNCLDALIGSDPIPPLAPDEWAPSLKKFFDEINAEKRKAA